MYVASLYNTICVDNIYHFWAISKYLRSYLNNLNIVYMVFHTDFSGGGTCPDLLVYKSTLVSGHQLYGVMLFTNFLSKKKKSYLLVDVSVTEKVKYNLLFFYRSNLHRIK